MMDIIRKPVNEKESKPETASTESASLTPTAQTPVSPLSTEVEAVESATSKKPFGLFVIGLAVLVFLAGGVALYLYTEHATLTQHPNAANQKKIETVVAKVGKLIDLPTGETPTLATVTDAESLKGQLFFENAQIGDEVLLYSNARKAYLYRPSQNILVEVASLNIGQ